VRPKVFPIKGGGVTIRRHWLDAGVLLQLVLGSAWMALLGVVAVAAADYAHGRHGNAVLILCGLLFAVVYLGLTLAAYLGIARALLNRTVVTATADELRVTHGPVPGSGGRHSVRRSELLQLQCIEAPSWRRDGTVWDLVAVTRTGRMPLVRRRPLEELLQIERAAEEALGIVDVPAPPTAVKRRPSFFNKSITASLLPVEVVAESSDDRIVVSWHWFNVSGIMILGLAAVLLFADLPQAVHLVRAALRGASDLTLPLEALLPPLLMVTCGALLLYFVLAFMVNRTYVTAIRGGTLAVRHGPLPLLPGLTVGAADVRQLFVQAGIVPGLEPFGDTPRVRALLADGRRVTLAKTPNADVALSVEVAIEEWLGITHERVPEAAA
jgi:hypothetical protein